MTIPSSQAIFFYLNSYNRFSPKLQKNALLVCANQSYQRREEYLFILTGIQMSHSTLQRLVNQQELDLPDSKLGVQ